MIHSIFTLLIIVGAIASFYQQSYILGVILLLWAVTRYTGYGFDRISKGMRAAFKNAEDTANSNCSFEFSIFIDKILDHPKSKAFYERLKKNEILDHKISYSKWKEDLISNYLSKYHKSEKKAHVVEKVEFKIKGDLLFKNKELDFTDVLYHDVFIPYKKENLKIDPIAIGAIGVGITIRVLLVNGLIKLQVGEFNEHTSSEVVTKAKWFEIYRKYETLSSIPVMYFGYDMIIPEKFLNFSLYGTDSYYLSEDKDKNIDRMRDWKNLWKDAHKYFYICANGDSSDEDYGKFKSISDEFDKKRKEWLKKENMEDPLDPEETMNRMFDYYLALENDFWKIFFVNQKAFNEGRERHVYGDYVKNQAGL